MGTNQSDDIYLNSSRMKVFVGSLVGDITGPNGSPDGRVDTLDIGYAARRFMCTPSNPLWDPAADINSDGVINMIDIGTVARHFNEHL
jgi:hypothetical protein